MSYVAPPRPPPFDVIIIELSDLVIVVFFPTKPGLFDNVPGPPLPPSPTFIVKLPDNEMF